MASRPPALSREIKERIIEMIEKGYTHGDIAEATGAKRQQVSYLASAYKQKGDAVFEDFRGRRRDATLTEEQLRGLYRTITEKKPREVGVDIDSWSETYVQDWFRKEFKRPISRHQIRRFCMAHNIRLTPEFGGDLWVNLPEVKKADLPPAVPEAAPRRKRVGRPPKHAVADDSFGPIVTRSGELDVEALQKEVAEAQKKISETVPEDLRTEEPAGKRYGKHRNQKRSPFTPKKRRKRR